MSRIVSFEGRNVVITGAGEGIGRGLALAFARAGSGLALCDIDSDALAETARLAELETSGPVLARCFDLMQETAIGDFLAEAARLPGSFGTIVHNAAIMPVAAIEHITTEQIDLCFGVKLRAAALLAKHGAKHLRCSGGASLLLMASATAHLGVPEHSIYGAANAALIGLARGLAVELAPSGIRVNTVSPGTVDSPLLHRYIASRAMDGLSLRAAFDKQHPRGQIASIEDVAAVFVFLAGPGGANITGSDLRCDGGLTVKGGQASI